MTTRKDIDQVLEEACDSFRGKPSSYYYKNYILFMLFIKYLSDIGKEDIQCKNNVCLSEQESNHVYFTIDNQPVFDYLYNNRNDMEIGNRINMVLSDVGKRNSGMVGHVLQGISFNDQGDLGETEEKNEILRHLLEKFNCLDLRPSQLEFTDIVGEAFEYMVAMLASNDRKRGAESFTPKQVCELLAFLVQPKEDDRIYDPTCGSGGLLLQVYKKVPGGKASIYGQEINAETWAICMMNMFLHGINEAQIWKGDTLSNPKNIQNDKLMKFQVVVANLPFSLNQWDRGFLYKVDVDNQIKKKMSAELDPYHRFDLGVPPASKGDYAFILHMLASLDEKNGRMAVVLPHGVLFRGASEGNIRRQIVEMNLLDTVIGLPANLFYGTSIPVCVLIFKKNRTDRDILFIDASGNENIEKGKNHNILQDSAITRIVRTYMARQNENKYSYVASFDEIKGNDFNLSIARYVKNFEDDEKVNIIEVRNAISNIEIELDKVQSQIRKYLEELGL